MSAKALPPRATSPLDTIIVHAPAYTEWSFHLIWDRDRQPYALMIDGRSYRVRSSPRLRLGGGGTMQTLFERVPFYSNTDHAQDAAEDGPPAA